MNVNFPETGKNSPLEMFRARCYAQATLTTILCVFTLTLFVGCSELPPRVETFEARSLNFDSAQTGQVPPGFTTALTGWGDPGVWAVREDSSAPGGGKVLVQERPDPINYRFPLCVYDGIIARDVAAEINFKPISGTLDQAGGIVLRYSPQNYYIARANALENNVILFKTVNGKRSKIIEVPAKVALGQWHTLRFEAVGKRLKVIFDGQLYIDTHNRTFTNPGKVGLWTKADSVSAFKDLKIERIPSIQ
jgi:hypothetical protein